MQDEEKNNDDANTLDTARRPSVLPIMTPPPMGAAPLMDRSSFSNSRVGSSEITTHVSHASRHLSVPFTVASSYSSVAGPSTSTMDWPRKQSFASTTNDSPRSSGRLSKPPPLWTFQ